MERALVIVPAYNEASVIKTVLEGIKRQVPEFHIVVINDGSGDATGKMARQVSRVAVLTHVINRGLGAAISTGLAYARENGYELAVTMDADGQHDPRDIKVVIRPILEGKAEVVIGSRTIADKGQLPIDRRLMIYGSNWLTWLLYGQKTSDSLSGFRAFSEKAIGQIRIKTDRMEVSNELFSEIKRLSLKVAEVPIKVIYTAYSRSKGQKNTNAVAIIFKLVLRLFR